MSDFNDPAAAVLRIATPLLLAGLGEMLLERSGTINIGVEGVMMSGAFCGFYAASASGSPLAGAAAGMLGGALLMLLFALVTLRFRADQIVAGMAINLLALGLTGTIHEAWQASPHAAHPGDGAGVCFQPLAESLRGVPVLGIFFAQTALTWAALALIPLLWFYLEKTERGLELRAVGENPAAAAASGLSVAACRWKACLAAGILGGLGGAFLSVSQTASYAPDSTQGRGFVALAAVVLGRYGTLGTAAASLFFGAAFYARDAVPPRWLPTDLVEMLPYVLTLAALCLRGGLGAAPAGLGKP